MTETLPRHAAGPPDPPPARRGGPRRGPRRAPRAALRLARRGAHAARRPRVPGWSAPVVPGLLMLAVGAVGLTGPALGWDENATWIAARRTPAQIVELAGNVDGVIAPYYLLMHAWMAVAGDSETALRLPSLLAVAGGVAAAGALGRRLFSPGVGLLAGVLLTVVPQVSRYAQEARAYGFAFLFATLATLQLHRCLDRPSRPRWAGYAAVLAAAGAAHLLALLVLPAHAYAVLARRRAGGGRELRRWVPAVAAALLPALPLAWLGATQQDSQLGWIPPIAGDRLFTAPGDVFGAAAVGLLLVGLALTVRWPADPRVPRELALLAAVPPAVLIAVSFAGWSLWVTRYVVFVIPAVCLLAAAALHRRPARTVLAVLLLVAVAVPAQREARGPAAHMGPDFRAVARVVLAGQRPGDAVVYGTAGAWSLRAGLDYQLRGRPRPRDVLLAYTGAQLGRLGDVQCADPVACLGTPPRVWLFRQWQTGEPVSDVGALGPPLRTRYRQVQVWYAAKATLVLLERR